MTDGKRVNVKEHANAQRNRANERKRKQQDEAKHAIGTGADTMNRTEDRVARKRKT